jgi:hypothetical protein
MLLVARSSVSAENSVAYVFASRTAAFASPSSTAIETRSASVEGVTLDSPRTLPAVIPGMPDRLATRSASSGERAMLA